MNNVSETEKGNDLQRSQLRMMRIQTVMIAAILAIVLAVGIFLISQFVSVKSCVNMIGQKVQTIDAETLNDAIGKLKNAAEQFDSINFDALNEAVSALKDAAKQFNEVDMEKLNDTVSALREAAENLSEVDAGKLNDLVASLNTTAEKLQGAVNAIAGVFQFGK